MQSDKNGKIFFFLLWSTIVPDRNIRLAYPAKNLTVKKIYFKYLPLLTLQFLIRSD